MSVHARVRQIMAIVCWLIAIVALFAAMARAAQLVLHGRLDAGTSTGTSIVVTVAYWLFALAVGWIAVTLSEHTLAQRTLDRGHDAPPDPNHVASLIGLGDRPAGTSQAATPSTGSLLISPQRAQRIVGHAAAERGRYDRDSAAWQARRRQQTRLMIATLWILAIGMATVAVSSYSRWHHSVFIQHHGIPVTATVISVENDQDCGRYGFCSTTAELTVRYANPVLGQTYGEVHYPSGVDWMYGTPLNVLVDPQRPTFAEVSGVLSFTKSGWVVTGLMAAIFTVFGLFALYAVIHHWRLNRTSSGSRTSATGA